MTLRTLSLHGPGAELPREVRAAWRSLRGEASASPYFHPDYAVAVARVAPAPVRVLMEGADTPGAILALQGGRTARPAGAPMSDYHGMVGKADARVLLRAAGVGVLSVSGWTRAEPGLAKAPVCRIDLSGGVESWRDTRGDSYRRHSKSHRRRVRKAARDLGEPRTVWRARDPETFETLLLWKRAQFAATGKFDVLDGWPGALIRDLWERGPDAELRADLHALYFGDHLAALDLGLAEGGTFHSWIVAYSGEFATYGPGIQLLEALIEAAPALGYHTLDLGVGLDGYKRHYANVEAEVGVGTLRTRGTRAGLSRAWERLETRAEPLARLRRRYAQVQAVEPSSLARARHMGKAVRRHISAGDPSASDQGPT